MVKPAIVAVGYNRPDGMKRLLDSIGRAHYDFDDITLVISIDESDKSDAVENVANNFYWQHGKKEIRRFPTRQGLRKHIVSCGDLSEKYGAVIILEDDLIVSHDFYSYVCRAHQIYSNDPRICGISLYTYKSNVFNHFSFEPEQTRNDVFLGDMVVTWGQSWTFEQWNKFKKWYFDHEGKLPEHNYQIPRDISGWTRSWGRYFASYMAEKNLSYIYPYIARSTCFSDFGEHNDSRIPFTFVQSALMQGLKSEYIMEPYEKLVHYDSFYERVLDSDVIVSGIPGNMICMDINNMKSYSNGKKYVITNEKLKFKCINSFGLSMRPSCINVIEGISGNQLHLYELNDDYLIRKWAGKRPKYYVDLRRLKYEFRDISWRYLIKYAPLEFFNRLKEVIRKKIKRK